MIPAVIGIPIPTGNLSEIFNFINLQNIINFTNYLKYIQFCRLTINADFNLILTFF